MPAGRKDERGRVGKETQGKLQLNSPVANLFSKDPGQQDVDPNGGCLSRQLKTRIAIARHGEGGHDQRQNGREATDRETREKGKGEAAHRRNGEDR